MGDGPNSLDFDCDWGYGFNVSPQAKAGVGYLLSWSGCGGLNLSKDIQVWNPMGKSDEPGLTKDTIKCVGLIESFRFEGGENDSIGLVCYVSKEVASEVRAKLANPLSTVKLSLSWLIIDFDLGRKAWYRAAFIKGDQKANANIDSGGGELQLFIASEPMKIADNLDLDVYRFEFRVVPSDKRKSTLEFATSAVHKLVKPWQG